MLALISWRNVWRNKLRSIVVILSIALGLWAGVFIMAFSWGLYEEHIDDVIQTQLSHIQIHHPTFKDNKELEYIIPNGTDILNQIQQDDRVLNSTGRLLVGGMASSAVTGSGVVIYGITPESEAKIIHLADRVVDGAYFEGIKRNPVLIGQKLADKLKVKVRSKIVLTFQTIDGEITAGAFRIAGIFKAKNPTTDESTVYVNVSDLHRLLEFNDGEINEIAMLLESNEHLHPVDDELGKNNPDLLVETWMELSPELDLIINSFNSYMYIFIGIILLALIFGIINTMLMAVLERVRELGMLMSIGLNKQKIFMMIMLETIFLAMVGGPLGMFISWVTITWSGNVGIDLGPFAEGFEQFGFSTIVYPSLDYHYYMDITLMAVGAAILAAIYPAIKALKLNPSEAIRKI